MKFVESSLDQLVHQFGGSLVSLQDKAKDFSKVSLSGFKNLALAKPVNLAFLSNPKLKGQLLETQAGVVLVQASKFDELKVWLIGQTSDLSKLPIFWLVENPYLYYARIQQWWVKVSQPNAPVGIHPSAVVSASAQVHPSASIGPCAVIGDHAQIGANAKIGAGVVLGRSVVVGENTVLYPNVSVYDECEIGANCIVHSGVVIGADGFGFAPEQGTWVKIPQVGRVLIADEVEIGANTTIDRGALDDTLIGYGVKLDNQIMIAHNVEIGEHTAMAGCVGVAGSARIGARCTIGGAAMIFGHLDIVEGTHVSGASTVMSSIKEPGAYTGIFPIDTHKAWEKTAVSVRQINKLRADIRALKKQ